MEAQLAKLIEENLTGLIRDELEFVRSHTQQIQVDELAEEIYSNIVTGLLLKEVEVYTALSRLYRMVNKSDSFEINPIQLSELLKWAQKDEIRDYLLRIITTNLLVFSEVESIGRYYEDSDCYIIEHFGAENTIIKSQNCPKMVQEQKNGEIAGQYQVQIAGQLVQNIQNKEFSDSYCKKQVIQSLEVEPLQNCGQIYQDISQYFQKGQQHNFLNEYNQIEERSQPIKEKIRENVCENNQPSLPFFPESTPHMGQMGSHEQRRSSFDSINNEGSFSSQQHIKTLKLTDGRRPNQQDQIMSDVSSFNNESSFVSASMYNVEDTSRYGHLLYGDKIDKILRSFISNSSIFLLVRWKVRSNGYLPMQSILQSITVKEHSPQQLIEFYQSLDS